ncbi:MAG: hypothetical protein CMG66_02590 [Candidatus Marinimicrobia bacterium]|nr:hypothetical protein [Candidatus Neomarinimicrobiota bacterium]
MKKVLIIYNVLFLLIGNVLLSNMHYMHDHDHHHHEHVDAYESDECQECIIIKNSNNYALDFQQINFSNNHFNLFVTQYYTFIEFDIEQIFLSRAPPIS